MAKIKTQVVEFWRKFQKLVVEYKIVSVIFSSQPNGLNLISNKITKTIYDYLHHLCACFRQIDEKQNDTLFVVLL